MKLSILVAVLVKYINLPKIKIVMLVNLFDTEQNIRLYE